MKFKYSAKTQDGLITKKGQIDALDVKSATLMLRERGLIAYAIIPTSDDGDILKSIGFLNRISLNDKVMMTEHLASMLIAGLPLAKSLELLVYQSSKKRMSEIVQDILSEVEGGSPLSRGLEKYPDVFDNAYTSLVKAGEASGQLGEVMLKLANTLERDREFRSRIIGALIYPIIISVAMVGVFIIIVVFVVPQMSNIYKSFNLELPFTTKILIATSEAIITYWWMTLLSIVGIVMGFRLYSQSLDGQYVLNRIALKVPIAGRIMSQSNVVSFARTLGLLIQAGVPIVESLEIVKQALSGVIFKDAVNSFIEDVKHGYPLSQSVSQDKNFPSFVSQMVMIGEETGTVDQRLEAISTYYEAEVDKLVKNLSVAIEPLIMIFLGVMVAVLIVSVILPIYQLTTSF